MQSSEYVSINNDLRTEESRDKIIHFITSHDSQEECEKEDKSLENIPSTVKEFPSSIQSILNLTMCISFK